MDIKSVKIPEQMKPYFEKAEKYVKNYFSNFSFNRENGSITIGDERYILVRAKSLRVNFAENLAEIMGLETENAEIATNTFLYVLAKTIGREDAKYFINSQKVEDPIAKLAAGPVSFNYTGWAFVEISPKSKPSTDNNFFLTYDHPYSFEADAYISSQRHTHKNVCIMNAGYSAGWCSESFGLELDAREIMCRAKGDKACRFVMGIKSRLDEYEKTILADENK